MTTSERVIPMVPALYDVLLDYCVDLDRAAGSPLFLTRQGNRQTPPDTDVVKFSAG